MPDIGRSMPGSLYSRIFPSTYLPIRESPYRSIILLLSALICVVCLVAPVGAADRGARVVVIVADYLSLADLLAAGPSVRYIMDNGGVGLVNTGKFDQADDTRYLTIGTGAQIAGSYSTVVCCNADERLGWERAGDIYERQMGKPAPEGSIVCLGFPRILRSNDHPPFRVEVVGLLGEAFHKVGLRTAVIGNSDIPDWQYRRAGFIAVGRNGIVDSGNVGGLVLRYDPKSPCGVSDDLEVLAALTRRYTVDHGLVVVELGDTSRIEYVRDQLSDPAYRVHRSRSLRNIDLLIERILPEIKRRGATLIVCSPCRVQEEDFKSNLAPVVIYKPGEKAGLLTSATTRTPGLIGNVDLSPAILDAAGLDILRVVAGQPAVIVHTGHDVNTLSRMERRAVRNYALRIPVLVGIAVMALGCATAAELALRGGGSRRTRRVLGLAFLILISLPAALLLVDSTSVQGPVGYLIGLASAIIAMLGTTHAITRVVALLAGRVRSPLAALHMLTAVLIVADVLAHRGGLVRWSMVACNQILGIRYYGLGNEYMGMLIIASLLGPILLVRSSVGREVAVLSLKLRVAFLLWFALVTWAIGHPRFGANVGGLVTAVAAFGVALVAISGVRFQWKHAFGLAAVASLAVMGFAAMDMSREAGNSSHLGRSVSLTYMYGWECLRYLLGHKIAMHIGILKTPQVYYPVLFSIPFFLMYGERMRAETAHTRQQDIVYSAAKPAVLAGALIGFLFNDSGIVPAALLISLYFASVLHLCLVEDRECE